jgi:hypothetical protein
MFHVTPLGNPKIAAGSYQISLDTLAEWLSPVKRLQSGDV